jgi:hypothetical protein
MPKPMLTVQKAGWNDRARGAIFAPARLGMYLIVSVCKAKQVHLSGDNDLEQFESSAGIDVNFESLPAA